jgi:uncharacterized membrane protein required for colicin V production
MCIIIIKRNIGDKMNIVDYIIIGIIIYFVFMGYSKGFILTLYGMASILLSWYITVNYYPYISNYIMGNKILLNMITKISGSFSLMLFKVSTIAPLINLISIVFTFIFSLILLRSFAILINRSLNYPLIKTVNKISGGILGFIEGFILLFMAFSLFKFFNGILPTDYWVYINNSQFAKIFLDGGNIIKLII